MKLVIRNKIIVEKHLINIDDRLQDGEKSRLQAVHNV